MELLEPRCLLSAVYPTADEQYLVELINQARNDPAAVAASFGIDLNEGLSPGTISADAKQPLAINLNLTDGARGHSQWMLDNNVFQHAGPGTAQPGDRMAWAGYVFTPPYAWGENIAWRGNTKNQPNSTQAVRLMNTDLFVDKGIEDRGHRVNMLSPDYTEIGAGVLKGAFRQSGTTYKSVMATEDFATTAGNHFLTGVAYSDTRTKDDFYTPGEGLGGITITAVRESDQQVFTTQTWDSGGYSLQLAPGTYRVGAAGAGLSGTVGYNRVIINDQNVKRDFTPKTATLDLAPPTATLADQPPIQYGGQSGRDLVVYYQDDKAMDSATIGNGDLQVTGPHGFSAAAILVGLSGPADGASLAATYRIDAPDGSWTQVDNGDYQVSLVDDAVADAAGNDAPGGVLGSFIIDIAPRIAGGIDAADDTLPLLNSRTIITGSDAGGSPVVQGFNPDNDSRRFRMLVFEDGYTGGVRVAKGDVNGDGTPDLVVASGGGRAAEVRVFDGTTGKQLPGPIGSFFPHTQGYAGGIQVAVGDVNGDGRADIITGVDAGAGPHVAVFSGADGSLLKSFWAYDSNFHGGISVGAGDVNGDGYADIITGPASDAGPHVAVFSGGADNTLLRSFWAYDSAYTGGIDVAGGDVNGDGHADLITTARTVSHVAVFSGSDQTLLASYLAYPGFGGQTRLGLGDVDGDGRPDILTGAGPGAGPHVKAFSSGHYFTLVESFFADNPAEDPYGIYVA